MAKLTKNQEHYWKGVADGRKEDEKRIAELESQLAALDWSPITQDNLPKRDEIVLSRLKGKNGYFGVGFVYRDWIADDLDPRLEYWIIAPPHTGAEAL